jgi:hypothetical protein
MPMLNLRLLREGISSGLRKLLKAIYQEGMTGQWGKQMPSYWAMVPARIDTSMSCKVEQMKKVISPAR